MSLLIFVFASFFVYFLADWQVAFTLLANEEQYAYETLLFVVLPTILR